MSREISKPILLIVANDHQQAAGLGQLGALLASIYSAEVIVLRVYHSFSEHRRYQNNLSVDGSTAAVLQSLREAGIQARAITAAGNDPGREIRRVARKVRSRAVLIGWIIDETPESFQAGAETDSTGLDELLEYPPCDIFLLDGEYHRPWQKILVPLTENPNSHLSMNLAQQITGRTGGQITAFQVLSPDTSHEKDREHINNSPGLVQKTVYGNDPVEEILKEIDSQAEARIRTYLPYDALILGASHESIIDPALLGGIPVQMARALQLPVLIVKGVPDPVSSTIIHTWRWIYEQLPKVTRRESQEAVEAVERLSHPRVDFFIMSALAAVIAAFGMLVNSPVVVIGAMLVEPLLAAITGVGLGIVEGDTRLLRNSLAASFRALLIAIFTGFFLALIIPGATATDEVTAYTRPTLFDLGIALASGLAGAYAIARKELSAALPGVAISVSLVPPLVALGIGLALAGDLDVVLGSLLTFVTNFTAIVIMGTLVFLLLGFGPDPGRTTEHVTTRRGLVWEALLSVALVGVLGILTARLISESNLSDAVDQAVNDAVPELLNVQVTDHSYSVSLEDDLTLILDVVIRSPRPIDINEALVLQEQITARLRRPVELRLSVIETKLLQPISTPQPTPPP